MAALSSFVDLDQGLLRYLAKIKTFPILTVEEETYHARLWAQKQDRRSAQTLITSHLRLVVSIAYRYRGYGLPFSEIISEGNIGLMQAVKRFDPEKGFRLATYALWWIKSSIHEFILRSWSLVKIGTTANQRKLFFKLREAKLAIASYEEGDLKAEHIRALSKRFNVPEPELIEMHTRIQGDLSLDVSLNGESSVHAIDMLEDTQPNQEIVLGEKQELALRHDALSEALASLQERDRRILVARRLTDPPLSLETLSREFGLSKERIRQLEVRAFERLQQSMHG